jgi:hypothetical protein
MWCSPATVLLILAVIVIVSGVRFNQGSFSPSTLYFPASSTSERVAAHKPDRESHVAVAAVLVVVVVTVVPTIAAAAVVAAVIAVSTHARALVPTTCCRVPDDSIRRVCRAHFLPASD